MDAYRRVLEWEPEPDTLDPLLLWRLYHYLSSLPTSHSNSRSDADADADPELRYRVLTLLVQAQPSAQSWLALAIECLRRGRGDEAEMALQEANRLDRRNASVWGYLALLCLAKPAPSPHFAEPSASNYRDDFLAALLGDTDQDSGDGDGDGDDDDETDRSGQFAPVAAPRLALARASLKWAVKMGLQDTRLLTAVGRLFFRHGLLEDAQRAAHFSAKIQDSEGVRALLVDIAVALGLSHS